MPAIAMNMPTRNARVTFRRHRSHPASVTKMGARFASSVELATDVHTMDQCHTPRSPAKKRPAPRRGQVIPAEAGIQPEPLARRGWIPVFTGMTFNIQRSGTASAQRQKALATGPVSARRTKIGAKAIAQPPARRQRKATRLMEAAIITSHEG